MQQTQPVSEVVSIEEIGERFSQLRIISPRWEKAMLKSLEKHGQLTPVILCRIKSGVYEMIDGFKRLRACRKLGISELTSRSLEMGIRACKSTILQLNRVERAMSCMEEALIVHSLHHEDGMTQTEIAVLLDRHKSWICRRIKLVSSLSEDVQGNIRLGLLPASLGVELSVLQRCNQDRLLTLIQKHRLTWRETRKLVKLLQNTPKWEHEPIFRDPRRMLIEPEDSIELDPADLRSLSYPVKRILSRLLTLRTVCVDVAQLLSASPLGQFEENEEKRLQQECRETLSGVDYIRKELDDISCNVTSSDPSK